MKPTAYQSTAYNSQGAAGVPAGLLTLPYCSQIGISLPITDAQAAQARAVNGPCFLDYEGLSLADAPAVNDQKISQLITASHAAKSATNQLGLYSIEQSWPCWPPNPGHFWTYQPGIEYARMLRKRGLFQNFDWLAVSGYCWVAPGGAWDTAWPRRVLNSLAMADAAGMEPWLFITPRCQGAGAPYDGQPLDPQTWQNVLDFARALADLRPMRIVVWDQTRFNQPWNDDVRNNCVRAQATLSPLNQL